MNSEQGSPVSIVIPLYNEAGNVRLLFDRIVEALDDLSYEIVIVNDGSTDGSMDVLTVIAAEHSFVKVIELRRNYGQATALAAGIEAAAGDIIVTMDADLQNDPLDIPFILSQLTEGVDLVQGWRKSRQDGWLRTRVSMVANRIMSWVVESPVHDIGCTLRAMRSSIAKEIGMYGDMHRFIPILALWNGAHIVEVPVQHHPRTSGVSKYGYGRILCVLLDLLTLKFITKYMQRPMRFFGGLGFLSLGGGIIAAIVSAVMKLQYGVDLTGNPVTLLSGLLVILGVQFCFLGVLGEVLMRIYFESSKKSHYKVQRVIHL